MELEEKEDLFPSWMVVPSSLKFQTHYIHLEMPPISELVIEGPEIDESGLVNRCPRLQILHFRNTNMTETIKRLLEGRRNNVAAGLEVGGIKMEFLKKLFMPLDRVEQAMLEESRGMVDEVLDSNLHPTCWVVEN